VDVGVAVGVDVGVAVGVDVGVEVGVDVGVEVGVDVGVAVGVDVGVEVGVDVGVEVGVEIGVEVGVNVGVAVGVAIGVAVGVAVGVVVAVGVGVGGTTITLIVTWSSYTPFSKWFPLNGGSVNPVTPTYQVPAESITNRHSEPVPPGGFASSLLRLSSPSHSLDPPLVNRPIKVSGSDKRTSSKGVVDTVTMSPTAKLPIPR